MGGSAGASDPPLSRPPRESAPSARRRQAGRRMFLDHMLMPGTHFPMLRLSVQSN